MTVRLSMKTSALLAACTVGIGLGSVAFGQPGPPRGPFFGRQGMLNPAVAMRSLNSFQPFGSVPLVPATVTRSAFPMGNRAYPNGVFPNGVALNVANANGVNVNSTNRNGAGQNGAGQNGRPREAPPLSAVQAPIAALEAGLDLSVEQTNAIVDIQEEFKQQREAVLPQPGQRSSTPPDPAVMQAAFNQVRALEQQANEAILAVLTAEQRQALPALLQQLLNWRVAGLPAERYSELILTAEQQQHIAAIAQRALQSRNTSRQQIHAQALAVLTSEQQAIVQAFYKVYPRP